MFTAGARDHVRERLLALAEEDQDVVSAAITGSYAVGRSDAWSDVDLAFGIRGELAPVIERWTEIVYDEFDAIHHWDLPAGSTIYRVFLLPKWMQVDIAFTPAADFGPRGPNWRTVFGETIELATPSTSRDEFIGWGWVCIRHARACITRGRPWQGVWCIDNARDNVFALACLRLGQPVRFARGADSLPDELKAPFEATLVHSLDEAELERALVAMKDVFAEELERTDAALASRLAPLLEEL